MTAQAPRRSRTLAKVAFTVTPEQIEVWKREGIAKREILATNIALAREAVKRILDTADFNRSFLDGRRNYPNITDQYKARRLELAEQREAWAAAIEAITSCVEN